MRKDTKTFLSAVLGIPFMLSLAWGVHGTMAPPSFEAAESEVAAQLPEPELIEVAETPVQEAVEPPKKTVPVAPAARPATPAPIATPAPVPTPTPAPAPVVVAPTPAPKPPVKQTPPTRRTRAS